MCVVPGIAHQALLTNVEVRHLSTWINNLGFCSAGHRVRADLLDFARSTIDGDRNFAIEARASDCEILAAFCEALIVADCLHCWHYFHVITISAIIRASLKCFGIVPGIAGATEESTDRGCSVASLSVDLTSHR